MYSLLKWKKDEDKHLLGHEVLCFAKHLRSSCTFHLYIFSIRKFFGIRFLMINLEFLEMIRKKWWKIIFYNGICELTKKIIELTIISQLLDKVHVNTIIKLQQNY